MTKDEALKLALACVEAWDRGCDRDAYWRDIDECVAAIKEALAAPVQEPIGYLFQHEETGLTTIVDVQQVEWGFEKNNPRHQKIGPVYTTPPAAQRPWIGLTDEEVTKMPAWIYSPDQDGMTAEEGLETFARAIEAKLKEKNT